MGRRALVVVVACALVVGGLSLGRASALTKTVGKAASIPFSNTSVPDDPSVIDVCLPGNITKVTAKLWDISNTNDLWPLNVLLVAPNGTNVLLVAGVAYQLGGRNGINGVDLTFDDAAPSEIPEYLDSGTIASGTYRPSVGFLVPNSFPQEGAPAAPFGDTLSDLNGPATGKWKVYVNDQEGAANSGRIDGGFDITITTDGTKTCGGGGGGGGTPPPTPTDWVVTFALFQYGPATTYKDPVGDYIRTETIFDGQMRFNKKPKRGEVSVSEAIDVSPTMTDMTSTDSPTFPTGEEPFSTDFLVSHGTYVHGDQPIIKFPGVVSASNYSHCRGSGTDPNVGKFILVDALLDAGDRFQTKRFDCGFLNKEFRPGDAGVVQVEIGDPQEVPEVA
jgi:hypothetical protein